MLQNHLNTEKKNTLPNAPLVNIDLQVNHKKGYFSFKPANQLIKLQDADTYRAVGNDPNFLIDLGSDGIKAGWYWFSVYVKEISGAVLAPKLYYDYGKGFNEQDVWNLPYVKNDQIACLIHLPFHITAMRFDPTTSASTFITKELCLKPANKTKVLQVGMSKYKEIHLPDKSYSYYFKELTLALLKDGHADIKDRLKQAVYFTETNTLNQYKLWCKLYDTITPFHLEKISLQAEGLSYKPLFSIIIPVYNPPEIFLKKAIESVKNQAYTNWEICIADDNSTNKNVKKILQNYQASDERIKVIFRSQNGHISLASNSALELATGEYIVLLDQDDELPQHSLYMVAEALNKKRDLAIIYSDEDKIDEYGNRFDPYFKTDWNRELFYGQNMISHLGVYLHSLIKRIGGFRKGFEGSQDYDLALRCIEQVQTEQIYHIPHILYHWRAIYGSTAVNVSNKNYAVDAGLKALKDHFKRLGQSAVVEKAENNAYRIKWPKPDPQPLVSIIIPTKDKVDILSNCIYSVLNNTIYSNYEVLIIDNNSTEAATHAFYEKIQKESKCVKVLEYKPAFNFSAMNNFGADHSKGEILLLLNNDTVVINGDWLCEMVSHCLKENTGVVGAKLFYPNGQIQHAGVFLHEGNPGNHIYLKREKGDPGYFNKLNLVQNYIAVTAACMAVRKELYYKAGGLDDQNLKVAYNDVDFCLKLFKMGYANIWTPFAQLFHHESLSRGNDLDELNYTRFKKEHSYILNKWNDLILRDPFFNPNLAFQTETTQFAFPPKIRYKWHEEPSVDLV